MAAITEMAAITIIVELRHETRGRVLELRDELNRIYEREGYLTNTRATIMLEVISEYNIHLRIYKVRSQDWNFRTLQIISNKVIEKFIDFFTIDIYNSQDEYFESIIFRGSVSENFEQLFEAEFIYNQSFRAVFVPSFRLWITNDLPKFYSNLNLMMEDGDLDTECYNQYNVGDVNQTVREILSQDARFKVVCLFAHSNSIQNDSRRPLKFFNALHLDRSYHLPADSTKYGCFQNQGFFTRRSYDNNVLLLDIKKLIGGNVAQNVVDYAQINDSTHRTFALIPHWLCYRSLLGEQVVSRSSSQVSAHHCQDLGGNVNVHRVVPLFTREYIRGRICQSSDVVYRSTDGGWVDHPSRQGDCFAKHFDDVELEDLMLCCEYRRVDFNDQLVHVQALYTWYHEQYRAPSIYNTMPRFYDNNSTFAVVAYLQPTFSNVQVFITRDNIINLGFLFSPALMKISLVFSSIRAHAAFVTDQLPTIFQSDVNINPQEIEIRLDGDSVRSNRLDNLQEMFGHILGVMNNRERCLILLAIETENSIDKFDRTKTYLASNAFISISSNSVRRYDGRRGHILVNVARFTDESNRFWLLFHIKCGTIRNPYQIGGGQNGGGRGGGTLPTRTLPTRPTTTTGRQSTLPTRPTTTTGGQSTTRRPQSTLPTRPTLRAGAPNPNPNPPQLQSWPDYARAGMARAGTNSWLFVPFLFDVLQIRRLNNFELPGWWQTEVNHHRDALGNFRAELNVHYIRNHGSYGEYYIPPNIQNTLLSRGNRLIGQRFELMINTWRRQAGIEILRNDELRRQDRPVLPLSHVDLPPPPPPPNAVEMGLEFVPDVDMPPGGLQ